ncbi:MAG: C25 family cysteine peptidase, partial [Flavobacteriales bacterium]
MIRLLLAVLLCLEAAVSVAQVVHGNEWIDHSRRHWRFDVFAEGLVRIDSAALANSGFPVATVDPAHFMVFGREKQVPIHVQGGEDGVFNGQDFIEFHVQPNDGWLDTEMYSQPGHQANPYYSLYNDTIRYFLTWDADAPKERIVVSAESDFASYPIRPYGFGTVVQSLTGAYRPGLVRSSVTSGFMLEGEGWTNAAVLTANSTNNGVEQTRNVGLARRYTGADAPPASASVVVVGINHPGFTSIDDHHLRVFYGAAPGVQVLDTIYRGTKVIRGQFQIPPAALASAVVLRFGVPFDLFGSGQIGAINPTEYVDQQVISNLSIKYAQSFTLATSDLVAMELPAEPGAGFAHIDMSISGSPPLVFAWGDTLRRIQATQAGNRWKALVPQDPTGGDTRILIASANSVVNVAALSPVNGTGFFVDHGALDLDSAMVIVTHASLLESANEYADLRRTSPKNPMPVHVVDVDDLYDQFGGGIPKHAFAIRRFARFILNTWTTDPQALFLIGKSVQTVRIGGVGYRPDVNGAYARCLVPSYGFPSSDVCFTLGLRFDTRRMDIPVGRLSAENNTEVRTYLDKVRTFESQPAAAWMKNILHFRGGTSAAEHNIHRIYLDGWKQLAEDVHFGGNVVDFMKTTSDVIQQASADSVRQFIEEGTTLMTFLAHASASTFDITIDDPTNYNWNGKHPMVLANSCYIGNVHLNTNSSTPEQWVMLEDKGPIAFLASIDLGRAIFLNPYTREFYRSFSNTNYGKSIGDHMRHAAFQQLSNSSVLEAIHNVHTFTLQGDPSLILNSWPEPDYVVSSEGILLDPAVVSADVDTFAVKVVVTNIGKAVNAPVNVALDRVNPTLGTAPTLLTGLENVLLRDTAVFRLPTMGFSGGQGINQLNVRVDLDPDEIPELDDFSNNSASTSIFITSGDLVPIYPYNYAILPDPSPELKASTGDPFAPVRQYVFQIDTADTFNSPILETVNLSAPGGVVSWQPTTIYVQTGQQDSTVYFWRCSIDSTGNGG